MNDELKEPIKDDIEQNETADERPDIVEGGPTLAAPGESEGTPASAAPTGEEPSDAAQPEEHAEATEEPEPAGESLSSPLMSTDIDENDRTWAMLAYIGQIILPLIPPIIILMVEPNRQRPFQRYHALHALALGIAAAIYEVFLVALIVFFLSSGILFCLGLLLIPTLFLPFILAIWYGIQAYQGRYFEIPGITPFLRQQRFLD